MIIHNLSIGYKRPLASGLNLSLDRGVTALIGRNGAGKSTLIKTLTGQQSPLEGSITINYKSLYEYSKKELARLIAVVSTDPSLAGGLRLHELVSLGRIPYTGRMGILTKEDREKVEKSMVSVGIVDKKDRFVAELSDGERQKGMIARGLVQETPYIIMDEPFSFLDVASRLEIQELAKELAGKENKSILFSTHEVAEALQTVDKVWAFTVNGVIEGSPESLIESKVIDSLFNNPKVGFDKEKRMFIWKPIN